MKLTILDGLYAVSRHPADQAIPQWATRGSFFSIGKTDDELSVVCSQDLVPDGVKAELNWKVFKVEGPLDFGLTGILASIANPLANAGISIFAISTFDTDYVMVKADSLTSAKFALSGAGFSVPAFGEREGRLMKKKDPNEPKGELTRIPDFLPPPEALLPREETIKITIAIDAKTLKSFKNYASEAGLRYQRIMREVLKTYARKYG